MSAFVIGIPVPEGLDPKLFRARVVVDRLDGAELTPADMKQIRAALATGPEKPTAKRRAKSAKPTAARRTKAPRPAGAAR